MATKKTQPRESPLDEVSPLRMSEIGPGNVTTSTAGKIAPFLDARHPDCVEACGLYASLFYNAGGDRHALKMSGEARERLIRLAPVVPAARHALAAAASSLWRARAHPEVRECVDALLPLEGDAPWAVGQFRLPWEDQRPASLTGLRQMALLRLYRAEALLAEALDEGPRALDDAMQAAALVDLPTRLQLSSSSQYWGPLEDVRLFVLVRAARAVRLRVAGGDDCLHRTRAKATPVSPDPLAIALATRLAEEALNGVEKRAVFLYAGLDRHTKQAHVFTAEQRASEWFFQAYLEAALLDEVNGNPDRARHRAGQAMFLTAPFGPELDLGRDHIRALHECVLRTGAVNTPLDAG